MQGNELRKKKKFQLKKRQRFRKNHRRGDRTRARARIKITPQTYGTEEVCDAFIVQIIVNNIVQVSVCMITHIARVWINRVRLPILLLVVS